MKIILIFIVLFFISGLSYARENPIINQEITVIKSNTQYGEEALEYHRYKKVPDNQVEVTNDNHTIKVSMDCTCGCEASDKKTVPEVSKWEVKNPCPKCFCGKKKVKKKKPKIKPKPVPIKKPKRDVIIKKVYIYRDVKKTCCEDNITVNVTNNIEGKEFRCE